MKEREKGEREKKGEKERWINLSICCCEIQLYLGGDRTIY